MKMLHFLPFMLALAAILFLSGCADQANQNPSNQPNAAAIAPTPRPQDFHNMPQMGGRY